MIIPMQKFNIVVRKHQKSALLSYLQERGDVEVVDVRTKKEEPSSEHEIDLLLAELDFVLDLFKERVVKEKEGALTGIKKFLAGPLEFSHQDFEKICRSFDYSKLVNDLKKWDNDLVRLQIEEKEQIEKMEILRPWQTLGLMRADLETGRTKSILGVLPAQALSNLKKVVDGEVNIRKVKEEVKDYYLVITYLKKNEETFLRDLQSTGFSIVVLPCENTPAAEIQKIEERLEEIHKLKRDVLKQIKRASREERKVKMVYDYWQNKKKVKDTTGWIEDTRYMSFISGWTSSFGFKRLQRILPPKFPGVYLEKTEKEKGERVPVIVANRNLMEPFESVTRIYGLPEYNELDPTPYLSFFFAIFFGMCLSDAGYGIVLLIASVAAVKYLKLSEGVKRLFKLMIYCSITTIIVGVLYGAYFSISLIDLPASSLRDFLLSLQVIDPIKSPLQIMIISLLFGLLQSWFARMVNVKYLLSKKRIKEALLGDFIWVWAILAIIFFGITKLFFPSLAKIGGYTVIGFAAILVLTQGYQKKNIFLKFTSGLLSLYKVVGMLSDILSYSRLLALGLTTSIIGLVINVIALLFRDMVPYVGVLVMIPILIGGHLFNMGINILGGFIHSARLQFVEFFPKFMEGGGRMFKPLKREYRFTKIKGN